MFRRMTSIEEDLRQKLVEKDREIDSLKSKMINLQQNEDRLAKAEVFVCTFNFAKRAGNGRLAASKHPPKEPSH
jgi:hypothetical protein